MKLWHVNRLLQIRSLTDASSHVLRSNGEFFGSIFFRHLQRSRGKSSIDRSIVHCSPCVCKDAPDNRTESGVIPDGRSSLGVCIISVTERSMRRCAVMLRLTIAWCTQQDSI